MGDSESYAVYSELEEGFLVGTSPSLWLFDHSAAVRFDCEAAARSAAVRRSNKYAVPVRLFSVNGKLEWEPLLFKLSPQGGTWVVTMEYDRAPGKVLYLHRAGKSPLFANKIEGAKCYKTEIGAMKCADQLKAPDGVKIQRKQITAIVIPIKQPK